MNFTDQIIKVANAYAEFSGISLKTASSRIFNEAKLLGLVLDRSATMTLSRAEKGLIWLSDNWPENAQWPEGVARPSAGGED